jgi:translation initiation factor SUI1
VHDFFAEAGEGTASTPARVDVTIKRRAGRKSTTTISGLEDDLNLDLICRSLRRRLKCSGALRDVPTTKEEDAPKQAIVLTGDQRLAVRAFLLEEEICPGHAIHIRGA